MWLLIATYAKDTIHICILQHIIVGLDKSDNAGMPSVSFSIAEKELLFKPLMNFLASYTLQNKQPVHTCFNNS